MKYGLKGIALEINDIARKKGDAESELFAKNALTVAEAIRNYCLRYAKEAQKAGLHKMQKRFKPFPMRLHTIFIPHCREYGFCT